MTAAVPSGTARLAGLSLLAGAGLALANLPAGDFPIGWLAALVAPGALLGRLPRTEAPWQRALLAMALQALALWLAVEHAGSLSRPAALAGTILPPMAFAVARQQESDRPLGLFLSFCVLLVGTILDGVRAPLVVAFGLAACTHLRATAHLAACRTGHAAPRAAATATAGPLLASALGLALPCLVAALAVDRTLGLLPSPGRARAPAAAPVERAPHRIGLDDTFVLDGGGLLADLHAEQLVRVHAIDGRTVPADLYLRSGFFAAPGLDRWRVGGLDPVALGTVATHRLRRPLPQVRVEQLAIERFAGARQFVFAPPGTVAIEGLDGLVADDAREWLRQLPTSRLDVYELAYQRLPPPPADLPVDRRARRLGLLTLPEDLDHDRFRRLLEAWGVGPEPSPAMAAIAAGLAAHCRYDRIEPAGPFAHTIENFLFAADERRGYCMHFASAAALLLRLRGIPCRIGVGLYGGEPDRGDATARLYGSQHAHAWVEIPYTGRGYVVFDPTPPAERGQPSPRPGDAARPGAAPAAEGVGPDRDWHRALVFLQQPWLAAALLLLVLASTLWRARTPPRTAAPLPPVARSARRLLARLLRALAVAGRPRQPGETLERLTARLDAQGQLPAEVRTALAAYQEVRFGGRGLDAGRELALQRGIAAAERLVSAAQARPATGQR
ncbi:MAG: DUF4129 domain-containing protein [Planctomycetes bacterium]|nr:DUF4129 domain-containing protein [Planctomycetota bacterium]